MRIVHNFILVCYCAISTASYSWTCSLHYIPVEKIPLSPAQQEQLMNGGGRRLGNNDNDAAIAIVLPKTRSFNENRRAKTELENNEEANVFSQYDLSGKGEYEYDDEATPISTEEELKDTVYQEGRLCACAIGLLNSDDLYYCPTPTDHCSVWRRRYSDDHGVTCFENTDWKIGFARYVWYYLCFALLLLALYPFVTRPGQVSFFFLQK